jgi:hypothetical protein
MLMFTVDNTQQKNGGAIKLYQHKFEILLNKCPTSLTRLFFFGADELSARRGDKQNFFFSSLARFFSPQVPNAPKFSLAVERPKRTKANSSETFPRIDSSQLKYFFHMLLMMMYTYNQAAHHHGNFSSSTFSTFHRASHMNRRKV